MWVALAIVSSHYFDPISINNQVLRYMYGGAFGNTKKKKKIWGLDIDDAKLVSFT